MCFLHCSHSIGYSYSLLLTIVFYLVNPVHTPYTLLFYIICSVLFTDFVYGMKYFLYRSVFVCILVFLHCNHSIGYSYSLLLDYRFLLCKPSSCSVHALIVHHLLGFAYRKKSRYEMFSVSFCFCVGLVFNLK